MNASWLGMIQNRLISHQPAVLFSQNESATSNQPQPASSTLLSEQTSTSQPNRPCQTCDFSCFLGKLSVLSISPLIIGRCYHPALECEVKANSLVSPIREFINWNIKEVFRSTRTCFVLLIFDHGSPLKGTPYFFLMKIKIVYIFRPS
jgi:hypothetical protein